MEEVFLEKYSGQLIDNWEYLQNIPTNKLNQYNKEYLSTNTLSIYCDMSLAIEQKAMAIACCYVTNGSILVEAKRVTQPHNLANKNIYGEVLAVITALQNFTKRRIA